MANSVDPDLTAPIGAVCSGCNLFASMLNLSIQYVHGDLCKHLGIDSSTDHPRLETVQTVEMCLYSANTSYLQEIILSNSTLTLSNCLLQFQPSLGYYRRENVYIYNIIV